MDDVYILMFEGPVSLVVGGHGRETEQSEASREGADGDRGGHTQSTRNGNPSELSCHPDHLPRSV
jgi:hypothetical protein